MSISAVLYPRWPPLLKIEISSNGQNCSILSQKVPKFDDYFIKILFLLSKWFQTRRFLWEFPIGSNVKLSSAVAVKIFLPCNFEVNPITYFGVIVLFSAILILSSYISKTISPFNVSYQNCCKKTYMSMILKI
jgi:hypothetical protein